jgi:hypothetical protein
MNEMRKLMEAVERLNEYLVRRGDKFDALLSLNVYEDILDDANENFLDFHGDARWQRVVNNYKGHALEQAKQIKAYAAKGRTLTDAEAAYAEETWYDGSDAYDNVEDAVEWLPEIFDAQLEAVEEILHGNIEGMHEANQGGKTEHSGAKKGKGAYYGRKKEAKRDSNKNRRNADKAQINEMKKFMQISEGDIAEAKVDPMLKKAAKLMMDVADELDRDYEYLANVSADRPGELEAEENVDGDAKHYKKLARLLVNGRGKQAVKFYDSLDTAGREFIYDYLEEDEIQYLQEVFGELGSEWLYPLEDDYFDETVEEGKDSAALHRVNANYSALKNDLARLVMEYRNDPDFDGIYLLDSLESLVERYTD